VTFRGRLTVFLAGLVLAPLLAGLFVAHLLAGRQVVQRADERLQHVEAIVQRAQHSELDAAERGLTLDRARRAFTAGVSKLDAIRTEADLDFLFVVRAGAVQREAMGTPDFLNGYVLVPDAIYWSDWREQLPAQSLRIHVSGPASGVVIGGRYLDRAFLEGLPLPSVVVMHGRVVASSLEHGPAAVPGRTSFDVAGYRGLCICDTARSGIAILTTPESTGFLPAMPGWAVGLIALGVLIATLLAAELARVISRPHERALGRLRETEIISMTDALTGIPNRRFLEATLAEESKRASRYGRPFSLLMVDVDRFKQVNDTHGHAKGDRVLFDVAARITAAVRHDLDTVARFGGEEFTVVLPETDPNGALVVAEKIRATVAEHPSVDGLIITVSVGVASSPEDGTDPTTLLGRADAALYEAKRSGRDRVVALR
jgi:diguanylate cyclase (GGDEF)-like protein